MTETRDMEAPMFIPLIGLLLAAILCGWVLARREEARLRMVLRSKLSEVGWV
jgi:hypothetical protein